jgi:hypothetical protein
MKLSKVLRWGPNPQLTHLVPSYSVSHSAKENHLLIEGGFQIFALCGVLEDVRTELMKSKITPHVPNLLFWAKQNPSTTRTGLVL